MGDDLVIILELDPKRRARQQLDDDTGKLQQFFLGHVVPSYEARRRRATLHKRKARNRGRSSDMGSESGCANPRGTLNEKA
ncbi:hypothetical protein Ms3S1_21210 [Methylosinus sp. 3S-1]